MKYTSLFGCFLSLSVAQLVACGGGDHGTQQQAVEGGSGGENAELGGNSTKVTTSKAGAGQGGQGGKTTASTSAIGGSPTGGTSPSGGTSTFVTSTLSPIPLMDKLDLVLVIDNSLSMGDKQVVLETAVPQLLSRLVNPNCISPDGTLKSQLMTRPKDECPEGMRREFSPLTDIHIGVVTSSLGDFGGDVCPESTSENATSGFPDQNDHGWLLGALPRIKSQNVVASDFLTWSQDDAEHFESRISAKTAEFRNFIATTDELGCGLEMPLEAFYRFLIDPKPPVDVLNVNNGLSFRGDVDQNILEQRKRFLRSDSVVAVAMLSDENDCSLKDSNAYSWVLGQSNGGFRMWRSSTACATNPNDECCYSCMLVGVDSTIPQKCIDAEPTCRRDDTAKLSLYDDFTAMRCLNVKQRFGFDFLFPVTRYSNALTKTVLCPDQSFGDLDCDCTAAKKLGVACEPGQPVENPLFANLNPNVPPTGPDRSDARSVLFLGILGVPWQDLATKASLGVGSALEYEPATRLNWDLFAPKDDTTLPLDPYMRESIQPRTGTNPVTGDVLQPVTAVRNASPINGHEWNSQGLYLQFACTFSLEQAIVDSTHDATRDCVRDSYCAGAVDEVRCAREFFACLCRDVGDSSKPSEIRPRVSLRTAVIRLGKLRR